MLLACATLRHTGMDQNTGMGSRRLLGPGQSHSLISQEPSLVDYVRNRPHGM